MYMAHTERFRKWTSDVKSISLVLEEAQRNQEESPELSSLYIGP